LFQFVFCPTIESLRHDHAVFLFANRYFFPVSHCLCVGNGTKQGGVLSPYLFSRYIRELIAGTNATGIGCNVGGTFYNILALCR